MTNFGNLKEHTIKTAKKFALVATVGAVLVTGVACDTQDESQAGVSNVSVGVIDSSNNSIEESENNFENSDISNENNREESNEDSQEAPKESTASGIEVCDYLKLASGAIYGLERGQSLEDIQNLFKEYELKSFYVKADSPSLMDPSVNAVVETKLDTDEYPTPCYLLETEWKHPVLGKQWMIIYIPTDNGYFANFCDKFDVPSNDLSQLKLSVEEIMALDEETSLILSEIITSGLYFKGLYELANENELQYK